MPTAFATRFSTRAAARLLERFGQSITYVPRSGLPRAITVLIDESTPAELSDVAGMLGAHLIVSALDDATSGILVDDADTGGDTLEFSDGRTVRLLNKITVDDGGGLIDWECG